ncbi:protein kinase [Trypanosoma rangeli SC58]|uniref:Protein kinase n=1 Tax=Trypanosoma rangeli SC58 TaxID=429131 RepID=A0A061IY97_TRYRA|nr:protein kinase [Trypanosoma rangeli SC58]
MGGNALAGTSGDGDNCPAKGNSAQSRDSNWSEDFDAELKILTVTTDDEFDVRSINDNEGSRRGSGGALSSGDEEAPNLAVFYNTPQRCFCCHSAAVTYECQYCESFYVCDECLSGGDCNHNPLHPLIPICRMHSFGSGTYSTSVGTIDEGASSVFYDPCDVCARVINDVELVHHCEECNAVICSACHQTHGSAVHEHEIRPFRRSLCSDATGSTLVRKRRNSKGNKVINGYVVIRQLGKGSYAKVNLVQHCRNHNLYALKILRYKNVSRARRALQGRFATDDDWLREIAVMKFVSHPNIVKLKEVIGDREAKKAYLIMEYCAKGPVHILGDPPLPLEKVRKYSRDIMAGLLHFHNQYLFHRDIKPANCLVDDNEVVKIADFGACSSQMKNITTDGTPAYSCPELITGARVPGDVVDGWAFALTVYQMMFGTLPVSTDSLHELRETLLSDEPLTIPPDCNPELRDLLSKMLEKDLSKRMLLREAAHHLFFCMGNTEEQSPYSRTSASDLNVSVSEPHACAVDTGVRGRGVDDCLHGMRTIRKLRRKSHAWDASPMDSDNTGNPDSGDSHLTPFTDSPTPKRPSTNEADALHVASIILDTLKRGQLKLHGMPLKEFPSFINDANGMRKIRLSHNGFCAVGSVDFSRFRLLREVSITNNSLSKFPVEVLAAPFLRKLDLSNNRIPDAPVDILKASMLEHLSLCNNCIRYVGTDASERSVFSGRCLRHVWLSGNPLAHLPAALQTCPRLELVLDDFPVLVGEWNHLLQSVSSVVVVWNDICPRQVCPEVPVFTAAKSIHLFSFCVLEILDIRHVVLPRFGEWLPIGELPAEEMEYVGQHMADYIEDLPENVRRTLQTSLPTTTDERRGMSHALRARPPILRRAACRFLRSYFIVAESRCDECGGYVAFLGYLRKCLEKGERVFVCFDEKKMSQTMCETFLAVLCQLIQERSSYEVDVTMCFQMVVDAMKGLHGYDGTRNARQCARGTQK